MADIKYIPHRTRPVWYTACVASILLSLAIPLHGQDAATAGQTPPAASEPAAEPQKLEPATTEFLKELQDDLRKVNSVQSGFTQTKQLAIFEHTVTIQGRFALEKPEKLIWIVDSPVKYAVRLHGQELRQWDQDTGKVQIVQLGQDASFRTASDQLKAWFLGDYTMLTEIFEIGIQSKDPLKLILTPKAKGIASDFLKRVELTFGKDRLYIQSVVAYEPGGDVTSILFTQTRINEPVKAAVWDMPPHE